MRAVNSTIDNGCNRALRIRVALLPDAETMKGGRDMDQYIGKMLDNRYEILERIGVGGMANVYKAHPELPGLVDKVLTSEHFSKSKPDPECFLKGMEFLGGTPEETVVFEDSFHGIAAGRAAGAKVIGLATTNKREAIAPLCDMVIDDFTQLSLSDLM